MVKDVDEDEDEDLEGPPRLHSQDDVDYDSIHDEDGDNED